MRTALPTALLLLLWSAAVAVGLTAPGAAWPAVLLVSAALAARIGLRRRAHHARVAVPVAAVAPAPTGEALRPA